jgi:hypothetical protein
MRIARCRSPPTPPRDQIFPGDRIRYETIEKVLERSPWTDVRTARLIDSLLSKGVSARTPGVLDETYSLA